MTVFLLLSNSADVGVVINIIKNKQSILSPYQMFLLNFLLQFQDSAYQGFGAWWTALYVYVNGNHSVNAFYYVVAVLPVRAATVRTTTHRNDVARLGHLLIQTSDAVGHFEGHGSRYNHYV